MITRLVYLPCDLLCSLQGGYKVQCIKEGCVCMYCHNIDDILSSDMPNRTAGASSRFATSAAPHRLQAETNWRRRIIIAELVTVVTINTSRMKSG